MYNELDKYILNFVCGEWFSDCEPDFINFWDDLNFSEDESNETMQNILNKYDIGFVEHKDDYWGSNVKMLVKDMATDMRSIYQLIKLAPKSDTFNL